MGILFRDARTHKHVKFGKRTVKDGEALAVWNERGEHTEIVGPRLVRLWMSTIRFLDRFVAGPNEYLVVTDTRGQIKHVKGPVAMFCNPIRHKKIQVKKAEVLASPNECLVVYTKKKSTDVPSALMVTPTTTKRSMVTPTTTKRSACESKEEEATAAAATATAATSNSQPREVLRRIVAGPAIFMPRVDEWTHVFQWTGLKSKQPQTFSILKTGARRFDTKIAMRTADSVVVTAKLSIQFNVENVTAVLEACEDPIAVLQSLLSSDLSEFGTLIRSDDMLNSESRNKITIQLGNLDTYRKLSDGARHMGLRIVGLCLKSLDASVELQLQYDEAIRTKAGLASARARAQQKQELVDLELSNQKRRMESEQSLAAARLAHELKMKDDKQKLNAEHQRRANEGVLHFLKELKGHGVDLTQYLVSFSGQKATINHLNKAGPLAHLTVPPPPHAVNTFPANIQ